MLKVYLHCCRFTRNALHYIQQPPDLMVPKHEDFYPNERRM